MRRDQHARGYASQEDYTYEDDDDDLLRTNESTAAQHLVVGALLLAERIPARVLVAVTRASQLKPKPNSRVKNQVVQCPTP
jgi:hypothetical protein